MLLVLSLVIGAGSSGFATEAAQEPQASEFKLHLLNHPNLSVHLLQTAAAPVRVIFIHGTPGTSEAFTTLLHNSDLKKRAQLISYDRPGFGRSKKTAGFVGLDDQVQTVIQLMDSPPADAPVILVGESYGALIAMRATQKNDNRIKAVVSLGGIFNADGGKFKWLEHLPNLESVRGLIPYSGAYAQNEISHFRPDLKQVETEIRKTTVPIYFAHGADDDHVDPKANESFIQLLPLDQVTRRYLKGVGHNIQKADPAFVSSMIIEAIDKSTGPLLKSGEIRPDVRVSK